MRSILSLVLLASFAIACTTASSSGREPDDQDTQTGDDDGSSSGSMPGTSSSSGGGGSSGSSGSSSGGGNVVQALAPTELIFQKSVASDRDHLMVIDYTTGESRPLVTLEEGTVAGWPIDGARLSPDRTHVALATRYGATADDVATGLSTNAIWSFDVTGGGAKRLTPTFPNPRPDRTGWRIDVRDPVYTPDASRVLFNYGEGDVTEGYVAPWFVSAAGGSLPGALDLAKASACAVNGNVTFHPTTGAMLIEHSVCIGSEPSGYFLYPAGGGEPQHLVSDQGVSLSSESPEFSRDGSMFVYTARDLANGSVQSLYAYLTDEHRVVTLIAGTPERAIENAAFAPDNAHMVFCVRSGDAYDLRVVDLRANPLVEVALTTDGKSCDPAF